MTNFVKSLFNPRKFKISLDQTEYPKLSLGDFFYLKELLDDLSISLKKCNASEFLKISDLIIELQTKKPIEKINLTDILRTLLEIKYHNNIESQAVFLKPPPEEKKEKDKIRYDYKGRNLAVWINLFAEKYHWSLSDILNLPIDSAIYLMQEIQVSEHFDKEFEYSLSEIAYSYDKTSGKSNYVPMKKPYWMDASIDAKIVKNVKYKKGMLPYGNVVDLSGVGVLKGD